MLETVKPLDENIREELPDIVLAIVFWIQYKITGSKSKNRQMGFHQTKKLLHRKVNNQQSGQTTYGMVENINEACILQGVNIQNI